jgi:hypothetical protein
LLKIASDQTCANPGNQLRQQIEARIGGAVLLVG